MTFRWVKYSGSRIATTGWRTSVELSPTQAFGPTTRRYGCVWKETDGFKGYYEIELPGQIEDVEIGPFPTMEECRRAVESNLNRTYPQKM